MSAQSAVHLYRPGTCLCADVHVVTVAVRHDADLLPARMRISDCDLITQWLSIVFLPFAEGEAWVQHHTSSNCRDQFLRIS
jgi:hypothetical protein